MSSELFRHITFDGCRHEVAFKNGLIHIIHDPDTGLTRVLDSAEMAVLVRKYELRVKACGILNKENPDNPVSLETSLDFFLQYAGFTDQDGNLLNGIATNHDSVPWQE